MPRRGLFSVTAKSRRFRFISRGYADSVQNLLVAAGLKSEMQFISRDESLPNTLDNLSAKGIVSAIILDELSEQRKSANVHFLHGCPRGEVQTSVTELPHWLKMQEEYNKYLIVTNKRSQSLRVNCTSYSFENYLLASFFNRCAIAAFI